MNKILEYKNNENNEFSPNIYVQKKDNFEETNNTINNLNEQIIILKRKANLVYEKDKEIESLELKIKQISKSNSDEIFNKQIIDKQNKEIILLKNEIKNMVNKNLILEKKNIILSKKIIDLYKKIDNYKKNNNNNNIDKEKIKKIINNRINENNSIIIDKLISKIT